MEICSGLESELILVAGITQDLADTFWRMGHVIDEPLYYREVHTLDDDCSVYIGQRLVSTLDEPEYELNVRTSGGALFTLVLPLGQRIDALDRVGIFVEVNEDDYFKLVNTQKQIDLLRLLNDYLITINKPKDNEDKEMRHEREQTTMVPARLLRALKWISPYPQILNDVKYEKDKALR